MNAIAASPEWYPQKLDLLQRRVLMIRMTQADYRAASFLDDRMLGPQSEGLWLHLETLLDQAAEVEPRPLHFIFHTGHVGSTLLSRLLDEVADIVSLREPLPLRDLATLFDQPNPSLLHDRMLEAFLHLWSRGYERTEAVVLKATSNTTRLAPRLFESRPDVRAVHLYMGARPTIETLLSTPSSGVDMASMADERLRRMRMMVPETEIPRSPGELAALTWAVERLTQRASERQFGENILGIDFEQFLEDPRSHLEHVVVHFGLRTTPDRVTSALEGPVMTQYSKKPEHSYSLELRAMRLARTRSECAEEIARGHAWLHGLAAHSADIAAMLE